jgi:membrane-associated phospholipid phosphatase
VIDGMKFKCRIVSSVALSLVAFACGAQSCGWSRLDHRVSYDASGVWSAHVYRSVVGALTVAQIGGAVWEGAETRIGKTLWQGIDSEIIASVAATAGKSIFTRVRPSTTDNPCLWFQGGSNYSFPSGEASVAAALVTPYVLEYGGEHPAAYALLLLPLYVGAGRIKNQAHWQTDVLAGWAVGGLSGWYAHSREVPIMIELLPHGFAVGYKRQF